MFIIHNRECKLRIFIFARVGAISKGIARLEVKNANERETEVMVACFQGFCVVSKRTTSVELCARAIRLLAVCAFSFTIRQLRNAATIVEVAF